VHRIEQAIGAAISDLPDSIMAASAIARAVRPQISRESFQSLLQNDTLQNFLKDDQYQDLICGLFHIAKLQGQHTQRDDVFHIRVLESVTTLTD
jgi:hypothetical protein